MKYVVLNPDNTVAYTFPEIDTARPELPITALYAEAFLKECIRVADEIETKPGMTWTGEAFIETNPPEPAPITLEEYRAQAIARLDGCCSGAIYGGCNVICSDTRGKKHYSFPDEAQRAIALMAQGAALGQTAFSYKADDEDYNSYTVAEAKVLFKTLGDWITANTKYKETLEKWIGQETDTTVLETIHYGSMPPEELLTELVTYLTQLNIDVTGLVSLFN